MPVCASARSDCRTAVAVRRQRRRSAVNDCGVGGLFSSRHRGASSPCMRVRAIALQGAADSMVGRKYNLEKKCRIRGAFMRTYFAFVMRAAEVLKDSGRSAT